MTTPVLFLDIDGVLHPPGAVSQLADGSLSRINAFCWTVFLEETLRDFPSVRVVVHSNWRLRWEADAELRAELPVWLSGMVTATTPRDVTERYASVQAYCAREAVSQYVIVDDEADAFPVGLPELVHCGRAGLSDEDTQAALWRALKAMCPQKKDV